MPDRPLKGLIRELKRRKVLQVAGVYAVVAWGVIEVAETIFPILLLPDWLLTAVTVLALLGFPLAVVLAWALELTPDGVRKAGAETGPSIGGTGAGTWSGFIVVLALTVLGGYLLLSRGAGSAVPVDRSIAVLPFENLSDAADNEYFSDGITEDILTNLSKIGDLRVISRTSVMTYKGSEKTVPEIARELEVAYVLEGSVRRVGDRVRITAQLIHAESDDHLWAEAYDRRLTDIFAIQSEIAQAIAGELEAELSSELQERLDAAPTENLRAYESYLKGRALVDQRTAEPLRQAIGHFERAIEQDSTYGLAWAGIADAVSLLGFYDYAVPDSAPDPLAAARRAVALAPDAGQTHASLGIVLSLRQNGPSAVTELERAIELTPSYGEAYAWLGWVRLMTGEAESALGPALGAVERDPMAPAYRAYAAEAHLANGQVAEALEQARRARSLQPEYGLAHFMEGLVLYHMARYQEAEAALDRTDSLATPRGTPSRPEISAVLALTRIAVGDEAGARRLLSELQEEPDALDARFSAALVLAGLGEIDAAFSTLRRVELWDSFSNEHFRYFFPEALVGLRADPRYPDVLGAVDRSWGIRRTGSD